MRIKCMIVLLLVGICACPVLAFSPKDCIFYAPFDGSFDAAQAQGQPGRR